MLNRDRETPSQPRQPRGLDGVARRLPRAAITPNARVRYDRVRDLPRLLQIWPQQIATLTLDEHGGLIERLRTALRRERQRGQGRRWSYDLSRHASLVAALRAELELLEARKLKEIRRGLFNLGGGAAPGKAEAKTQEAPAAASASSQIFRETPSPTEPGVCRDELQSRQAALA